MPKMTEAGN